MSALLKNSTLRQRIRLFLVGLVMGVANIIPGVSGGTMAVVFGIYEDLMNALSNVLTDKKNRKSYLLFLLILFSGALISVLTFAKALSWAFNHYELMTIYFFIGLILGSIPVVVKAHHDMQFSSKRIIGLLTGMLIVIILAHFQDKSASAADMFDYRTVGILDYSYFILCGILSASAMIIPGISGSFILILLGAYRVVLESISGVSDIIIHQTYDSIALVKVFIIGSLAIGIVIGIFGFAKIINWAFKHYPAVTLYFIVGLLMGSIYQIYPGYELSWNGFGAVILFAVGILISLKFGKHDEHILDSKENH
jgi:putative membrane protein